MLVFGTYKRILLDSGVDPAWAKKPGSGTLYLELREVFKFY